MRGCGLSSACCVGQVRIVGSPHNSRTSLSCTVRCIAVGKVHSCREGPTQAKYVWLVLQQHSELELQGLATAKRRQMKLLGQSEERTFSSAEPLLVRCHDTWSRKFRSSIAMAVSDRPQMHPQPLNGLQLSGESCRLVRFAYLRAAGAKQPHRSILRCPWLQQRQQPALCPHPGASKNALHLVGPLAVVRPLRHAPAAVSFVIYKNNTLWIETCPVGDACAACGHPICLKREAYGEGQMAPSLHHQS